MEKTSWIMTVCCYDGGDAFDLDLSEFVGSEAEAVSYLLKSISDEAERNEGLVEDATLTVDDLAKNRPQEYQGYVAYADTCMETVYMIRPVSGIPVVKFEEKEDKPLSIFERLQGWREDRSNMSDEAFKRVLLQDCETALENIDPIIHAYDLKRWGCSHEIYRDLARGDLQFHTGSDGHDYAWYMDEEKPTTWAVDLFDGNMVTDESELLELFGEEE